MFVYILHGFFDAEFSVVAFAWGAPSSVASDVRMFNLRGLVFGWMILPFSAQLSKFTVRLSVSDI